METNVGKVDRILRIFIGCLLVVLSVTGIIGAWGWLGLILVATGLMSFCPVYTLLGKNTCHKNET